MYQNALVMSPVRDPESATSSLAFLTLPTFQPNICVVTLPDMPDALKWTHVAQIPKLLTNVTIQENQAMLNTNGAGADTQYEWCWCCFKPSCL